MTFKQSLKTVIEAMSVGIVNETIAENPEVFHALKTMYDKDRREFLDILEVANYTFADLMQNVMDVPEQKNRYIVPHIASGLYEHFHESRIEKVEGVPFSADKSSFIKMMTIKALNSVENLPLYADYNNVEEIKKDKERKAYWSPPSVKDTDEAMELFWKWYNVED